MLRNRHVPYIPRTRDHFGVENDLLGQPSVSFLGCHARMKGPLKDERNSPMVVERI